MHRKGVTFKVSRCNLHRHHSCRKVVRLGLVLVVWNTLCGTTTPPRKKGKTSKGAYNCDPTLVGGVPAPLTIHKVQGLSSHGFMYVANSRVPETPLFQSRGRLHSHFIIYQGSRGAANTDQGRGGASKTDKLLRAFDTARNAGKIEIVD